MAKRHEIYKCDTCGNIVEVFHGGPGPLACCGQPMKLMAEGKTEGALEKHVPVIEKTPTGFKVSVGSVLHPMTEEHYIEWIEILNGDKQRVFFLKPGDQPVIEVTCSCDASNIVARAYCNLHGNWKSQ